MPDALQAELAMLALSGAWYADLANFIYMPSFWPEAKSVYFSYLFLGEFPGSGRAGPFALWEDVAAYLAQKYVTQDCVYMEQERGRDYFEYRQLTALLPNAQQKTGIY